MLRRKRDLRLNEVINTTGQQAKNCVLKKNQYMSHVKCESLLLHNMTMMMRRFDRKAMHEHD